jgi:hypothetical protein
MGLRVCCPGWRVEIGGLRRCDGCVCVRGVDDGGLVGRVRWGLRDGAWNR